MTQKKVMKNTFKTFGYVISLLAFCAGVACAAANEAVLALAKKEQPGLLQTMKELVEIESGSADFEGLEKIAALIASRLKDLGAKVEMIEPGPDTYKMFDTPEKIGRMVKGTFTGTGTKKILLIAHMDTVYRAACCPANPSRSRVTAPMAWASPTTNRESQ